MDRDRLGGIPSGAAHSTESPARATAAAIEQTVPQYGPCRVQKYVVEDRLAFIHEWYANRFERLRIWANTSLTESLRHQYFNIVANGTAEIHEPPTYAQITNMAQHEIERLQTQVVALHKERDNLLWRLEQFESPEESA